MIPVLSVLAADLEHQHHQSTRRWGQPAGWTVLSHCRTISHPTRPSCVHASTPNAFSSQSPLVKKITLLKTFLSLHCNSKQPLYQILYNCLGLSQLMVLILQQTVLVTVLAITSAGKISCALSITNVSHFALCGLLRWFINHQTIWPTNKQTNMQWRNHES